MQTIPVIYNFMRNKKYLHILNLQFDLNNFIQCILMFVDCAHKKSFIQDINLLQ